MASDCLCDKKSKEGLLGVYDQVIRETKTQETFLKSCVSLYENRQHSSKITILVVLLSSYALRTAPSETSNGLRKHNSQIIKGGLLQACSSLEKSHPLLLLRGCVSCFFPSPSSSLAATIGHGIVGPQARLPDTMAWWADVLVHLARQLPPARPLCVR